MSFFVDKNIAKAKTIDTDFYIQQQFYEAAYKRDFQTSIFPIPNVHFFTSLNVFKSCLN